MANANEFSVLVVDDEPAILSLITVILERNGLRVLPARNGDEALSLSRRNDVEMDLLLCDVMMPGMNGPELVDRIREVRPDLRVLFMSAFAEQEVLNEETVRNSSGFISKPFDNSKLLETVKDALTAERAFAGTASGNS